MRNRAKAIVFTGNSLRRKRRMRRRAFVPAGAASPLEARRTSKLKQDRQRSCVQGCQTRESPGAARSRGEGWASTVAFRLDPSICFERELLKGAAKNEGPTGARKAGRRASRSSLRAQRVGPGFGQRFYRRTFLGPGGRAHSQT